jgi:hypothetical protein
MVEYRIKIGHKSESSGKCARQPGKREMFKAAVITVLALSAIIGIFLAAFIVGSIIASVLLVLLAASLIVGLIRWLLVGFGRKWKSRSLRSSFGARISKPH